MSDIFQKRGKKGQMECYVTDYLRIYFLCYTLIIS